MIIFYESYVPVPCYAWDGREHHALCQAVNDHVVGPVTSRGSGVVRSTTVAVIASIYGA